MHDERRMSQVVFERRVSHLVVARHLSHVVDERRYYYFSTKNFLSLAPAQSSLLHVNTD